MSDDFPTFDLPKNAISDILSTGQWLRSNALLTNSAEDIFIVVSARKKPLTNPNIVR